MAANSGGRGARTPAGGSGSRGPLLPTAPALLARGLGPGCLVTPRVRRECLRALSLSLRGVRSARWGARPGVLLTHPELLPCLVFPAKTTP